MFDTRLIRLPDQSHTHAHEHHQLVMSLAGRAEFEVNGCGGEVCRMRACLVPGEAGHVFAGVGDNRMLIIDLGEDNPTPEDPDLLARLFEAPRYPTLDADFQNLLSYAGAELARYGSDPLLTRALGGVLIRALHLRLFGEQQPLAASGPLDLERLDAHIVRNLARRITVAELAQVACLRPEPFPRAVQGQRRPDPAPVPAQGPPRLRRAVAAGKPPASGADRRGMRLLQPERADHGDAPLPGADAEVAAQGLSAIRHLRRITAGGYSPYREWCRTDNGADVIRRANSSRTACLRTPPSPPPRCRVPPPAPGRAGSNWRSARSGWSGWCP